MKIERNDLIALISIVYKSETYYKELENGCLENLQQLEKLKNELSETEDLRNKNLIRVTKLKQEFEDDDELSKRVDEDKKQLIEDLIPSQEQEAEWQALKNNIIQTEKDVKEMYDELKQLKSGNEAFFKWKFLGLSDKENLDIAINNKELNDWLNFNLINEQKIIFSKINVENIEELFDDDIGEKKNLLDYLKKVDDLFFFMCAPYGFKGKETVFIYLQDKDNGFSMKCKNEDVVKYSLLNTFEEVDISMLNKLTVDNDLTRLFKVAEKEASQIDLNYINKEKINDLSKQLKKLLRND